jgi:hypothetical protein
VNKKIFSVAMLVALVSGGAFAQLALGVTGALNMDQQLSASEISNDFKNGDNIYYGGFVEILGKHLGLGVSLNVSPVQSETIDLINYDADLYLSYHIFKATGFLDPFLETGLGVFALDYKKQSDKVEGGTSPIAESPYWYGALGLGINLGHRIGVFGKFAYNWIIQRQGTDKDTGQTIPYYGTYAPDANGDWAVTEYVPTYRFTLGLKLIL